MNLNSREQALSFKLMELVTGGPASLLAQYSEVAAGDFVRPAVMRQPNIAMRDTDMLPRKVMERSLVYQRSRELDLALEQVMAVMLLLSPDQHAGLTLYRDRRRPFSQRERAILQRLTPHLASTVRNCRIMGDVATSKRLLETLFQRKGAAYVVVLSPSREQMRTPRAATLLSKWFTRSDCDTSGLPRALVERLRALTGLRGHRP